jgi:signal transduction histidine kinase
MKIDLNKLSKRLNTLQAKLVIFFVLFLTVSISVNFLIISLHVRGFRTRPFSIDTAQFTIAMPLQPYTVKIQENIQAEREAFEQSMQLLLVTSIILQLVVAIAGSTFIVKRSLEPLNRLNKIMDEINDLNLRSKIISHNSADEIGDLITNFNRMIEKIQGMVEKEKEFIQNISHELKTPLTTMRVNLESMLLLNDNHEDTEQINHSIESIDYLAKLINDLILISRIERNENEMDEFDAIDVINNAISEIQKRKASIRFNHNVDKSLLKGSKTLFHRVIENLIENSIKYSKGKADITIGCNQTQDKVTITIEDKGIGIPADKLENIFERFYRVDSSRSRQTGGYGLGLSIVKSIVELFGGTIKVESEEGKGTKFTIAMSTYQK